MSITRAFTICLLASSSAVAQVGPIGVHQGGLGAELGSSGGEGEFVPIVFPPERDGLPLPVRLARSGGAVSDAGAGWSLTIPRVFVSNTTSQRRPQYLSGASGSLPPTTPAKFTLSLGGGSVALVAADGAGHYRALADHLTWTATASNAAQPALSDNWQLADGEGHIYHFQRVAGLDAASPWFLTSITGGTRAQAKVTLAYHVEQVSLSQLAAPNTLSAPELILDGISYDFDASGCAKYQIVTHYQSDPTQSTSRVLATYLENGGLRVRTKILNNLELLAQGASCGTAITLLRYWFAYDVDPDTTLPRLVAVNRSGEQNTPEENKLTPVIRYQYGQATRLASGAGQNNKTTSPPPSSMKLQYTETTPFPLGFSTNYLGRMSEGGTSSALIDLTGDGLPDFFSETTLAVNQGGVGLKAPIPWTTVPVLSSTATTDPIGRYGFTDTIFENTNNQVIDVNGDGRLDYVIAITDPGQHNKWQFLINEPGADSATPSWRSIVMDVTPITSQLSGIFGESVPGVLPVQRAQTFTSFTRTVSCTNQDGTSCCSVSTPDLGCRNYPPQVAGQVTFTEWKLADVNGDGFPDVVANTAPIVPSPGPVVCNDGIDHPWPILCTQKVTRKPASNNDQQVFLNVAGARPNPASTPFASPIPLMTPTHDSVEEFDEDYGGAPGVWQYTDSHGNVVTGGGMPTRILQIAGWADINGDGILDRVAQIEEPDVFRDVAFLGNGRMGDGYPVQLPLPDWLQTTDNDQFQSCAIFHESRYSKDVIRGFIDVTGDGIPDYVYGSGVQVGTGNGFGPEIPIDTGGNDWGISIIAGDCAFGTEITQAGLFDIDGDGRREFVVAGTDLDNPDFGIPITALGTSPTLRVFQLDGATAGLGARDGGRIIEERNGYGGERQLTWTSAKHDTTTLHQVPFPEIVLDHEQVVSPGGDQEPTYYASGGARLWFDFAADHWSFRGYDRHVSLRGTPDGYVDDELQLQGVATIADQWTPEQLSDDSSRYLNSGRPHEIDLLAGELAADPWRLLTVSASADSRWSAMSVMIWGTSRTSLPGYTSGNDCTAAMTPYGAPALVSFGGTWDLPCASAVAAYPGTTIRRRGSAGPPSSLLIESYTTVSSVDAYARPTQILHGGDMHRSDDDYCEEVSYAAPLSTSPWQVLGAVSQVRRFIGGSGFGGMDCSTTTRPLGLTQETYDGLAWGAVDVGLPTVTSVERMDMAGNDLAFFNAQTITYLAGGGIDKITVDAGGGRTRAAQASNYDGFQIKPSTITTTSGTLPPLTETTSYDPYTLAVTQTVDANGTVHRFTYDGYGRPLRTTKIDPSNNIEMVATLLQYLGDTAVGSDGVTDTIDANGRRLFSRVWHDNMPLSSLNTALTSPPRIEVWSTSSFDALGRGYHSETQLGADYAYGTLVTADRSYDTLGRLAFAARPYDKGDTSTHYGETYTYRPDGVLLCAVAGRGPQSALDTSPSEARYADCQVETFAGYQRTVAHLGAEEGDSTSPHYNLVDVEWSDAGGRVLGRGRQQGTTAQALERMDFAYDPLGHRTSMTRYHDAVTPSGAVTWTDAYDTLGQIISQSEPGAVPRTFNYDDAGELTSITWMEPVASRAITRGYDGYGRLTRIATKTNGSDDNGSVSTFVYDTSPGHTTSYALGRMTQAISPAQTRLYRYDGLGRTSVVTYIDSANRVTQEAFTYRFDGGIYRVSFAMPDTGSAGNNAYYFYDSAQRPNHVQWIDENHPTVADLATNIVYDHLGRLRSAHYFNGNQQTWVYRDADRNELLSHTLAVNGATGSSSFTYDDALRLASRTDVIGFGTARNELTTYSYDGARHLATATVTDRITNFLQADDSYSYDGLGSLFSLTDNINPARSFVTLADATDLDRLCRVDAPGAQQGSCNYSYDVLGRVTQTPLGFAGTRTLGYDGYGRTTQLQNLSGGMAVATAAYQYDALGEVARLDDAADGRSDVRSGGSIELQTLSSNGVSSGVFERRVPLPGATLVKRGAGTGAFRLLVFGEPSGDRTVTDESGTVADDLNYFPYGQTRSSTGTPGSLESWKYQWNGGDVLTSLAASQIGGRMYDWRTGRFLSRDPIAHAGSSSLAHPYMFAGGDPISRIDPTGFDSQPSISACSSGGTSCLSDPVISAMGAAGALAGDVITTLFGGLFDGDNGNHPHGPNFHAISMQLSLAGGALSARNLTGTMMLQRNGFFESVYDSVLDTDEQILGGLQDAADDVVDTGVAVVRRGWEFDKTLFTEGPDQAVSDLASDGYHLGDNLVQAVIHPDATIRAMCANGCLRGAVRIGVAFLTDDPEAGLKEVVGFPKSIEHLPLSHLPPGERQAVMDTLKHIDSGTEPLGPLKEKWGTTFKNVDNDLPSGRSYKEYRVAPGPLDIPPGPRRIVVDWTNDAINDIYYTWTHYGDHGKWAPAFVRIVR